MKFTKGDILIDSAGFKRKVLTVIDDLYITSYVDNFQSASKPYTEQELINTGYKLYNPSALRLEVGYRTGSLHIIYDDIVGMIDRNGKCSILDSPMMVDQYSKWRKNGCLIEDTILIWRGGEYQVKRFLGRGEIMLKRIDIAGGAIYNLNNTCYERGCEDDNIIRHEHNNCPIGF